MSTLRQSVFDHYGWFCSCCGSTLNLSIDHVNGDGKVHREIIGEGSGKLYRWLASNGFPDGFQTLCKSCNSSKQQSDMCNLHGPRALAVEVGQRAYRRWYKYELRYGMLQFAELSEWVQWYKARGEWPARVIDRIEPLRVSEYELGQRVTASPLWINGHRRNINRSVLNQLIGNFKRGYVSAMEGKESWISAKMPASAHGQPAAVTPSRNRTHPRTATRAIPQSACLHDQAKLRQEPRDWPGHNPVAVI